MATEKQIAANQRNSRKSTGPKTQQGKRNSSANALLHGFTAKKHVLDCEDPHEFQRLTEAYASLYQPADEAAAEVVRQLVTAQWSLQRTRLIEKGLLDDFYETALEYEEDDDEEEPDGSIDPHTRLLAAAYRNNSKTLARYTRYAAHFQAQWWRCYRRLEHNRNKPPLKTKDNLASFPQNDPVSSSSPAPHAPAAPGPSPSPQPATDPVSPARPVASPPYQSLNRTDKKPVPAILRTAKGLERPAEVTT